MQEIPRYDEMCGKQIRKTNKGEREERWRKREEMEKERRDGERERRWRKRGEMEKEEKVRKGRHFIYLF